MADVSNLNVGSGATIATLHITGDATFDKNVSVAATLTTLDLAVNGHIITEGNTPTTTVLVAAGPNATVSITGNDISGTITITTGDQAVAATKTAQATSGPTAGELAKVIFDKPYGKIPHILLAPSDQTSAGLAPYPGSRAIDSFTLGLKTIPQPNTIYSFEYFITQ